MAFSGNAIYAGTNNPGGYPSNKILKTTDNGISWTVLYPGAPSYIPAIATLAYDNYVFGAFEIVSESNIYRSTNSGTNWTLANTGFNYKLALQFASIGNSIFAAMYSGGVFKTTNNGESWFNTSAGLNYETVWSIVSMGTDLLAGLGDKGVYKSVNQGESWSPTSLTNHQVEVLYTKGNEVYAGGLSFINQGGIYKSTNNGGTWYSLGLNWETIYAITANDNYLFASVNNSGIFRTSNEGLSWIQVNTGLQT